MMNYRLFFLLLCTIGCSGRPALWLESTKSYYKDLAQTGRFAYPAMDTATASVKSPEEEKELSATFFRVVQISQKYATPANKEKIQSKNPYKDKKASIITSGQLPAEEIAFRKKRKPIAKKGLEQFFGKQLTDNQAFTTGFIGSGGGYRAMTLTTGYAKALEDVGLLDASMYIGGLSGSTWFVGPWIFTKNSVAAFKKRLLGKIKAGTFALTSDTNIESFDIEAFASNVLWPKFINDQPIGLVDFYGGLLSHALLDEFTEGSSTIRTLHNQWEIVQDATRPFPFYTSVAVKDMSQDLYHWYEFNPLQVRNLEFDYVLPSWAYDSSFEGGKSEVIYHPQSMGYLLGTFGSAFEVSVTDLYNIFYKKLSNAPKGIMAKDMFEAMRDLLYYLSNLPGVKGFRLAPAQVYNPFQIMKKLPDWLSDTPYRTLVDGGIHYNFPIRPLCLKARDVQVVILCDSSGNILDGPGDIPKMFADLKSKFGYVYTRVDDKATDTLRIYKDLQHADAPRIIYVNYLKDDALIKKGMQDPELKALIAANKLDSFNPQACLTNGYCNTYNFAYTEDNFNQLSAMAEFNVKVNLPSIKSFLEKEFLG